MHQSGGMVCGWGAVPFACPGVCVVRLAPAASVARACNAGQDMRAMLASVCHVVGSGITPRERQCQVCPEVACVSAVVHAFIQHVPYTPRLVLK